MRRRPAFSSLQLLMLTVTGVAVCLPACGNGDDNVAPALDASTDVTTQDQVAGDAPSDGTLEGTTGDTGGNEAEAAVADGGATLESINHFVIIYMENHSFDNLYGEFPGADGLLSLDAAAPNVAHTSSSPSSGSADGRQTNTMIAGVSAADA